MESNSNVIRIIILVGLLIASTCHLIEAQTFGELFNQKKTQKKYLLEQIAALQIYIGVAKKGYDITTSGLRSIKDITAGEFGLHAGYISALKAVSPVIRNNIKIPEIVEKQLNISRAFNSINLHDSLSLSDQLYINEVREKVMDECEKDLEELLLVVTAGKVEMNEKERIIRIDRVYESMTDKYAFAIDFVGQVMTFFRQAEKEQDFIKFLRKSYEIN